MRVNSCGLQRRGVKVASRVARRKTQGECRATKRHFSRRETLINQRGTITIRARNLAAALTSTRSWRRSLQRSPVAIRATYDDATRHWTEESLRGRSCKGISNTWNKTKERENASANDRKNENRMRELFHFLLYNRNFRSVSGTSRYDVSDAPAITSSRRTWKFPGRIMVCARGDASGAASRKIEGNRVQRLSTARLWCD